MSVQTETNFDLDLQDHFLTSFHNCMKDFARELDKKREVKVLESVKTLSKDDVKETLKSFYHYIDSTKTLRKVIEMDGSWITEGSSSGESFLSFISFSDIEAIMVETKSKSGIWRYIHLFLLLSMQYLQVNSDVIQELSELLKPSKTSICGDVQLKKKSTSKKNGSKLDFESLKNDPFLKKLEESKIGKMAKELAQSMNFEDLARQLGGGMGNNSNPISSIIENMTKNPEMLKSMLGKIGENVKSQLSKSELQGQELKDEVENIISSLKESPLVNNIIENIGPLTGGGKNPLNIVKGVISSLSKAGGVEEVGSIDSLSDDLETMWKGDGK